MFILFHLTKLYIIIQLTKLSTIFFGKKSTKQSKKHKFYVNLWVICVK